MDSSSTAESPVTGHVALWVLLTLAISSMAQPASYFSNNDAFKKHGVYLCSSPIYCLTHAAMTLVRVIWAAVALSISPIAATKMVLCVGEPKSENDHNKPGRWIFFLIGTLPAAVKLCSFSGLPWTQIWGLMFISSYVLIEGLIFIAGFSSHHLADSVPEALGHSSAEWQRDGNEKLRDKIEALMMHQESLESLILVLAFLIHVALSVWALHTTVLPLFCFWKPAPALRNAFRWISLFVALIMAATVPTSLLLSKFLRRFRPSNNQIASAVGILLFFLEGINAIVLGEGQPEDTIMKRLGATEFLVAVTAAVLYGLRELILIIFRKFPTLERVLLLMPAPSNRVGQDHAPTVTTNLPNEQSPTNDKKAVESLLFFLWNLSICIVWYTIKYDPSGTTNPSWTDIFG